ncbi:MAG TPA: hypothetical protein VE487_16760 [Ilumatobacter sp.]|jgi:hypothetical protein|nr:hypothetical protein [Ilumatobacter sp.]
MATTIKPGTRLFSAVCTAEFIVVRAPAGGAEVTIGGLPALASADEREGSAAVADGHGGGVAIGKRYVDADDKVELLCTKPGEGVPAVDGRVLTIKEAKPLPASD